LQAVPLYKNHTQLSFYECHGTNPCYKTLDFRYCELLVEKKFRVLRTGLNMFKRFALSGSAAACCIAGCAVLPEYRETAPQTADVIRHIKCELLDAAYGLPENEWVRDWTAGLIFTFKVDHTGGLESDLASWRFPLNGGANFTISMTGGFSGQGTRTEVINFKVAMKNLVNDVNKGNFECYPDDRNPNRFARLGGRLGIADLFARARHTMDDAHVPEELMSQLSYNIDYIIKLGGTAQPRFNLVPIGKEKVFTGSLKWTGMRSDTQSLKITLTPPPKKKGCSVVALDGSEFKDCPLVFAAFPLPVKPACSILGEDACTSESTRCKWTPRTGTATTGRCTVVPVQCASLTTAKECGAEEDRCQWNQSTGKCTSKPPIASYFPTLEEVPPPITEGPSEEEVRRNDAAQVQNLILESGLLEP